MKASAALASADPRWLSVMIGEKKSAVRLECVARVLDRCEIFSAPLLPPEFKGVIYFNDEALPVLNWKTFGIEVFLNPLILVLERGRDRLGLEIEGTGKIEEHILGAEAKTEGVWIELDSGQGLWGLEEERLFSGLKPSPGRPGRLGGKDGKEDLAGG